MSDSHDPLVASLLDNSEDGITHADWLVAWAADAEGLPLAVATGFVNIGGLDVLASAVAGERGVRILLGAEPEQGLEGGRIADQFEAQIQTLGQERDFARFPPSRMIERLQRVDEWLADDAVEVRRYSAKFLHGKAYLFGHGNRPRVHAVTSANLTYAGLHNNLELGAVREDSNAGKEAVAWFDRFWNQSEDFKPTLRDLLFPDIGIVDPREVYLRALREFFGELPDGRQGRHEIFANLVDFQRSGYQRAREILEHYGGVIFADGVGTGKTEIGLALVEHYCYDRGNYALIIAPAGLVNVWQRRVDQAMLPAQVVSFNDIAADEQLNPDKPGSRILNVNKDAYRLIVVDEAHALRNPDTRWHQAVARLSGGGDKRLALLTATPINNSLDDLLNLVMLFAKHDRAFHADGIPSLRKLFKEASGDPHDPESIDPDKLFDLIDLVVVRRDRRFIEDHYPDARFQNGTPVRFPKPLISTPRYPLDAAHPGMVREVAIAIDNLELARYTPSRYLISPDPSRAQLDNQLAGLLRSGVLKRFESSWHSCLSTVNKMLEAHDLFLRLWDEQGVALFGDALAEAAKSEVDSASLGAVIESQLEDSDNAFAKAEFKPEYRDAVEKDRARLAEIHDQLSQIDPADDTKLAALVKLIEGSKAGKIAVFSTFADTIRYLDEQLPEVIAGKERVVVIGNDSTPDARLAALSRFAPSSVVEPGYVPADGEVDLMLATDVLSEGQNLQQADCVISYDMPWNPQRVVQRNGRVIRLLSPHDTVSIVTMLPEDGDLEAILRLEAKIRTKIRAAAAIGMESQVIADDAEPQEDVGDALNDLTLFAEGLATEAGMNVAKEDPYSGAFLGEEMRALFEAAIAGGEMERIDKRPWAIGSSARVVVGGRPRPAGLFFATRTKPLSDDPEDVGLVYWRYVDFEHASRTFSADPLADDDRLEMLRRINPTELESSTSVPDGSLLEDAWDVAAGDIVRVHNERYRAQAIQIPVGPQQVWARALIGGVPEAQHDAGALAAYDALAVERGQSVRRELKRVRERLDAGELGEPEAVRAVVSICAEYGLEPVKDLHATDLPREIDVDDLGVVCWMAVGIESEAVAVGGN